MIISNASGLTEFCTRDVFGTRITAYYKAYEGIDGAKFFTQRDVNRNVTSAISKIDGVVTLCCSNNSDFNELSSYLRFIGAQSVMCGEEYGELLGLKRTGYGSIVESPCDIDVVSDAHIITSADELFSYKNVYDTLNECGFCTGNYNEWLADISLRVRRDTAEITSIIIDDTVVATASALFITENAVLLGAVGTLPQFRGKGYGGTLVRLLSQKYTSTNHRTELLCENHRLSFYKMLGFHETGKWFAEKK